MPTYRSHDAYINGSICSARETTIDGFYLDDDDDDDDDESNALTGISYSGRQPTNEVIVFRIIFDTMMTTTMWFVVVVVVVAVPRLTHHCNS